jgi:hypothetical protein
VLQRCMWDLNHVVISTGMGAARAVMHASGWLQLKGNVSGRCPPRCLPLLPALTVSKSSPSLSPNSTVTCTSIQGGYQTPAGPPSTANTAVDRGALTFVAKGSVTLSIFTTGFGTLLSTFSAVAVAPLLDTCSLQHSERLEPGQRQHRKAAQLAVPHKAGLPCLTAAWLRGRQVVSANKQGVRLGLLPGPCQGPGTLPSGSPGAGGCMRPSGGRAQHVPSLPMQAAGAAQAGGRGRYHSGLHHETLV